MALVGGSRTLSTGSLCKVQACPDLLRMQDSEENQMKLQSFYPGVLLFIFVPNDHDSRVPQNRKRMRPHAYARVLCNAQLCKQEYDHVQIFGLAYIPMTLTQTEIASNRPEQTPTTTVLVGGTMQVTVHGEISVGNDVMWDFLGKDEQPVFASDRRHDLVFRKLGPQKNNLQTLEDVLRDATALTDNLFTRGHHLAQQELIDFWSRTLADTTHGKPVISDLEKFHVLCCYCATFGMCAQKQQETSDAGFDDDELYLRWNPDHYDSERLRLLKTAKEKLTDNQTYSTHDTFSQTLYDNIYCNAIWIVRPSPFDFCRLSRGRLKTHSETQHQALRGKNDPMARVVGQCLEIRYMRSTSDLDIARAPPNTILCDITINLILP